MGNIALAIHGGAGTILRSRMTPKLEAEYRAGLEDTLQAGWSILDGGGSALDAVEAAVVSLEDCPLFNAGRGSVFTHEGKNEMDAAIMNGPDLRAGAVALVRNVKNPIKLARLVMERTEHVLLAGDGADLFAEEVGVELCDNTYFYTDFRWKQLEDAIAADRVQLDHAAPPAETRSSGSTSTAKLKGTVGAVACDAAGRLAAATSTGGMTNKRFGRVGDTAIIGAGIYADDMCAVSCTGHGEFFIRGVTAYDVAARLNYRGLALEAAARETLERLTAIGGDGGFIAVDRHGQAVLPFNCEGMYRAFRTPDASSVAIYRG